MLCGHKEAIIMQNIVPSLLGLVLLETTKNFFQIVLLILL